VVLQAKDLVDDVISHAQGTFLKRKSPFKMDHGPSNFLYFGNPAIPVGPVVFRPTIARGLALSVFFYQGV
jgi:hypothetical protein